MATGNIFGKTNNPIKIVNNEYTGLETDTTSTIVNNDDKTIAVEVKKELLDKIDALETQVSVYNYFYSIPDEDECQIAFLPLQDTKYLIREICAKWVPDEDYSLVDEFKYFYKTEITESNTFAITEEEGEAHRYDESIFDEMNPFDITLYQTGALEDITTSRFGYDNIDLVNKKINRYCYAIPLSTLVKKMDKANPEADPRVVSDDIKWSTSNNGSINIRFTALGYLGIYCESGFMIKTSNPDDKLEFVFATSNFSIRNLTTKNPEVTSKKTAVSYLESSLFDDFILVFKLQTPISEDFTGTIILNELKCDNINRRGVCNTSSWQIGIQASYLSLQDLVYSKEQSDTKFLTKVDFEEEIKKAEHITKIGNLDDSNKLEARTPTEVYSILSNLPSYPKYACATFVPVTEESEPLADEPVPFIGYTFLINQNRGTFETPDWGYYVISNGKTYWFNSSSVTEIGSGSGGDISLSIMDNCDIEYTYTEDPDTHEQVVNTTSITFPDNILPTCIYDSTNDIRFYLDYTYGKLLGPYGTAVDNEGDYPLGTIEWVNGRLRVNYESRYYNYEGQEGFAEWEKDSLVINYELIDSVNANERAYQELNTYTMLNAPVNGDDIRVNINFNSHMQQCTLSISAKPGMLITRIEFYYMQGVTSKLASIYFDYDDYTYKFKSDSGSISEECTIYSATIDGSQNNFRWLGATSTNYRFLNISSVIWSLYSGTIV